MGGRAKCPFETPKKSSVISALRDFGLFDIFGGHKFSSLFATATSMNMQSNTLIAPSISWIGAGVCGKRYIICCWPKPEELLVYVIKRCVHKQPECLTVSRDHMHHASCSSIPTSNNAYSAIHDECSCCQHTGTSSPGKDARN
jgi:hypothetical protein